MPTYIELPGSVKGAASSTDNALVRFDGTDGKVVQNSTVTVSDVGTMTLTGTTGALVVHKLTSEQRDALTATAGMIIYNTTTSKLQVYTTAWTDLH